MQSKHATPAGMGAPVRLRPQPPRNGGPQEKAAGHQYGTTAAIESQHLDFASLTATTPVAGGLPHA
jgi:hypothetical protein